jgi:hypothetical protein
MATRTPLVIISGVVQQLPSGDTIDGGGPDTATLTNSNAGSAVIGMPVYSDGAGTFDLAQADAAGTYLYSRPPQGSGTRSQATWAALRLGHATSWMRPRLAT